jgi:hypothetical protein
MNLWTFGRTPWTGDQPVARSLPTQDSTTQKNADTHPCLQLDSNPRSQYSSGRRQTAWPLGPAVNWDAFYKMSQISTRTRILRQDKLTGGSFWLSSVSRAEYWDSALKSAAFFPINHSPPLQYFFLQTGVRQDCLFRLHFMKFMSNINNSSAQYRSVSE